MPLTEIRTNDLGIQQWSGSGYESIPVAISIAIPPELVAEGLSVTMYDFSTPTEIPVVPVTEESVTGVLRLDTYIASERTEGIAVPSVCLVMQDYLLPTSVNTTVQHATKPMGPGKRKYSQKSHFLMKDFPQFPIFPLE